MTYLSIASIVLLMSVHFGVTGMRFLHQDQWRSAGAGIAISYVFLDVLPHLASSQGHIQTAIDGGAMGYLAHHAYLLALIAFIFYLSLARISEFGIDTRTGSTSRERPHGVVHVLVVGLAAYCALIGFLIGEQPEHRYEPVIIFAMAMTIHMAGVDHVFRDRYAGFYDRMVRYVFASATLLGWLLGAVLSLSDPVFGLVFSFVVGAVLVVAFIYELPVVMKGRGYWPFLLGTAAFAALLLIYEALANIDLDA